MSTIKQIGYATLGLARKVWSNRILRRSIVVAILGAAGYQVAPEQIDILLSVFSQ